MCISKERIFINSLFHRYSYIDRYHKWILSNKQTMLSITSHLFLDFQLRWLDSGRWFTRNTYNTLCSCQIFAKMESWNANNTGPVINTKHTDMLVNTQCWVLYLLYSKDGIYFGVVFRNMNMTYDWIWIWLMTDIIMELLNNIELNISINIY